MALYKDIDVAISDKYFTQPLPQVAIPLKKPVNTGPFTSDKDYSKGPFIQNFNISGYKEIPPTTGCPKNEILYRYGPELLNLNNGKVAGGFDSYNSKNIPSCSQRTGNYMTFSSMSDPFSNMLAYESDRNDWYRDTHSS